MIAKAVEIQVQDDHLAQIADSRANPSASRAEPECSRRGRDAYQRNPRQQRLGRTGGSQPRTRCQSLFCTLSKRDKDSELVSTPFVRITYLRAAAT